MQGHTSHMWLVVWCVAYRTYPNDVLAMAKYEMISFGCGWGYVPTRTTWRYSLWEWLQSLYLVSSEGIYLFSSKEYWLAEYWLAI